MTEVQYALEAGIEVKTQVNGEYVTCYWKLSEDAPKYNATEEITLAEAKKLGLVKEEVKTEGNDYTVLIETLNGKVTTGQIMRAISYLNKKDIGSVTKVELEERNGDLVGYVYGTNNSFRIWQSTRVSPRGKQHFKINVSKL